MIETRDGKGYFGMDSVMIGLSQRVSLNSYYFLHDALTWPNGGGGYHAGESFLCSGPIGPRGLMTRNSNSSQYSPQDFKRVSPKLSAH